MAATNQDIKDFFALSGNNPAVTNPQLLRVQAWVRWQAGLNHDPDPDDLVDYLYSYVRDSVVEFEKRTAAVTF